MITISELMDAIRRAHELCGKETKAATDEYNEAVKPLAAVRKERGRTARANRDAQIQRLRDEFDKSRRESKTDE